MKFSILNILEMRKIDNLYLQIFFSFQTIAYFLRMLLKSKVDFETCYLSFETENGRKISERQEKELLI